MAHRNKGHHLNSSGIQEALRRGGVVYMGEGSERREVRSLNDLPKAAQLVKAGTVSREEAQASLDERIAALQAEREQLVASLKGEAEPPSGGRRKAKEGEGEGAGGPEGGAGGEGANLPPSGAQGGPPAADQQKPPATGARGAAGRNT